jgi:hypothetical protein
LLVGVKHHLLLRLAARRLLVLGRVKDVRARLPLPSNHGGQRRPQQVDESLNPLCRCHAPPVGRVAGALEQQPQALGRGADGRLALVVAQRRQQRVCQAPGPRLGGKFGSLANQQPNQFCHAENHLVARCGCLQESAVGAPRDSAAAAAVAACCLEQGSQ